MPSPKHCPGPPGWLIAPPDPQLQLVLALPKPMHPYFFGIIPCLLYFHLLEYCTSMYCMTSE